MAGSKTVKAKTKASGVLDKIKFFISGGAGRSAGAKLGDGLINMHKKKKK